MADNGNREPNDTYRRAGGKRRREPPIIDASATEVPAEPASPPGEPAEPAMSPAAEPVLFGSALRDASGAARETARDDEAAPSMVSPEPVPDPATADPVTSEEATPTGSAADMPSTQIERETGPAAGVAPDLSSTAPREPVRSGASVLPAVLGLVILGLLGAITWLLYTGPQRSGRDELAGTIADLKAKVAALEARPDPGNITDRVAALDKRVGAADADRAQLTQNLAGLTTRLETVGQQAQAAKEAADTKPVPVASPPAPVADAKPAEPAYATLAAEAALASKVEAIGTRLDGLAGDQSNTAKSLADLPKPAPVDLGPVNAKIAALDSALNGLGGSLNGSDARLNGFDAKINAVDGKVNGFDARMNGLDVRMNGVESKANDAVAEAGKLKAAVANLPKVDLQPLQAATSGLEGRIGKLESDLSVAKDDQRVTEARAVGSADESRAAPVAVIGQAIERAIADGRPYATEISSLKSLGGEDDALAKLAPLADTGAPSVDALKAQWDGMKGDVVSTARPAEPDNALDRLAASARALVQVHRVGTVRGDAPQGLAPRIDEALDRGDVAGALDLWGKLPAAGRAASQAWADAAQARIDAETAARDLVGRAIETLGRARG